MSLNHIEEKLFRISNLAGPVEALWVEGRLFFRVIANEPDIEDKDGVFMKTSFYEGSELMFHDKFTIIKALAFFSEAKGLAYPYEYSIEQVEELDKWLTYFIKAYHDWIWLHNPLHSSPEIILAAGLAQGEIFYEASIGAVKTQGIILGNQKQAAMYALSKLKGVINELAGVV